MALDEARVGLISGYSEVCTEKQFKKMGFTVKKLDRGKTRKRPDFLVSDSSGPMLVAEVKAILSGGFLEDRGAHISTLDPELLNSGVFGHEVSFDNIDEAVSYSIGQYRSLIADEPAYRALPLAVVLFFDFFSDHFRLYPRRMSNFPELSGLLKLEEDRLIREMARSMTLDELRERTKSGSMKGLPSNTKEFRVLQNECATIPLPTHFVMGCIVS